MTKTKMTSFRELCAASDKLETMYKSKNKGIADGFTMNILDWMLKLELKPFELLTYALIYQFSQPGSKSAFTGSLNYIQKSLQCDKKTVCSALDALEKRGLVKKESVTYGTAVKHNRYSVILTKLPLSATFITIQGWMLKMGLKPSELLVYAVVYAFSMPGSLSAFMGTANYLVKVTGLSLPTVKRVIKSLQDAGHISEARSDGRRRRAYFANYPRAAVVVYNEKNKNKENFKPIIIGD